MKTLAIILNVLVAILAFSVMFDGVLTGNVVKALAGILGILIESITIVALLEDE